MWKKIAIVLVLLGITGCVHPGSGFLGGQGISIHAEYGSNIESVTITINDGGFAVPNPMRSPTTQPAK